VFDVFRIVVLLRGTGERCDTGVARRCCRTRSIAER